jgi:hypothetical protein
MRVNHAALQSVLPKCLLYALSRCWASRTSMLRRPQLRLSSIEVGYHQCEQARSSPVLPCSQSTSPSSRIRSHNTSPKELLHIISMFQLSLYIEIIVQSSFHLQLRPLLAFAAHSSQIFANYFIQAIGNGVCEVHSFSQSHVVRWKSARNVDRQTYGATACPAYGASTQLTRKGCKSMLINEI